MDASHHLLARLGLQANPIQAAPTGQLVHTFAARVASENAWVKHQWSWRVASRLMWGLNLRSHPCLCIFVRHEGSEQLDALSAMADHQSVRRSQSNAKEAFLSGLSVAGV